MQEMTKLDDGLQELLDGHDASNATPDGRPEVLASIESWIDPHTNPPTIIVCLRVQGRAERVYCLRRPATASAATLLVLAHALAELEPARVLLATDDPIVARLLDGRCEAPAWLRRVWEIFDYEMVAGDMTVTVERLFLGDDIGPEPVGNA